MAHQKFRFVDLFAGLGGFHYGLSAIGGECVFACEKNEALRTLYIQNHKMQEEYVRGDIAECIDIIPEHDLLVAGFPCQPFSKSGKQEGFEDVERGGCIFYVLEILERYKPKCFIFENVGNLSRHNNGKTWKTIKSELKRIGYCVRSTADELTLKQAEKHLSPHLFGYPQRRERFFAVGSLSFLPREPFPIPTGVQPSLRAIMEDPENADGGLTQEEKRYTAIKPQAYKAIELWNKFILNLPQRQKSLPSFPLWLEEYEATYPYVTQTPYDALMSAGLSRRECQERLEKLPPYAREQRHSFPLWKVKFIDQNREWMSRHYQYIDPENVKQIRELDYTYRKLEWNVKDSENPSIWGHTIQTRPSGIRVSTPSYVPTIMSIVSSQTPIYGQYRRHLTVKEIARAFGFPDDITLPSSNIQATKALGNAVHADVVRLVATRLMGYTHFQAMSTKAAVESTEVAA